MANPKPAIIPIDHKKPQYAPKGYVLLLGAIDIVGKVLDPEWTGEEPRAPDVPERTPEDLDREAAETFDREITDNSSLARSEVQIRKAIQEQYDQQTAPRKRRQAAVERLREMLIQGVFAPIAFSTSGEEVDVPRQVWAADVAEEIFDTGLLLILHGRVTFRPGLVKGDDTALVMIKAKDIEDVLAGRPDASPTGAGEEKCRYWLIGLMRDGSSPTKPKPDYRDEARKKFPRLGDRGFVRAWDRAIAETGNRNWSKPGPKSNASKQ